MYCCPRNEETSLTQLHTLSLYELHAEFQVNKFKAFGPILLPKKYLSLLKIKTGKKYANSFNYTQKNISTFHSQANMSQSERGRNLIQEIDVFTSLNKIEYNSNIRQRESPENTGSKKLTSGPESSSNLTI